MAAAAAAGGVTSPSSSLPPARRLTKYGGWGRDSRREGAGLGLWLRRVKAGTGRGRSGSGSGGRADMQERTTSNGKCSEMEMKRTLKYNGRGAAPKRFAGAGAGGCPGPPARPIPQGT